MPTETYTLISSQTLSSAASTITFSNLNTAAAGMTDLIIVGDFIASTPGYFRLRYNGDTTDSNYFYRSAGTTGSTFLNSTGNQAYIQTSTLTDDTYRNNFVAHIFDFSATNKHKSTLARMGNSRYGSTMSFHRWANTSAVTSLELATPGWNFNSGATFQIYGLVS